ncbi:MAG: hypothetical protein NUV50_10205 [Rhodospirillales bacterium]|nr:hypothetical protein [Rhodospirillales bacterium]
MSNKYRKVFFVAVRISTDELSAWNKAWREHGHRSRSDFIRKSVNTVTTPGDQNASVRSLEEITHLKRAVSILADVQAKFATNDNVPNAPELEEELRAALKHVLALSKVA